jgi:hypothetical protein
MASSPLTLSSLRREIHAALDQIAIVGQEMYYPAAWWCPGAEATAMTSRPLLHRGRTVAQQRLALAVEHLTGEGCDDDTLDAAVRRLYTERHVRETARALGARGGRARARGITPAQRTESARTAVTARWAKEPDPGED